MVPGMLVCSVVLHLRNLTGIFTDKVVLIQAPMSMTSQMMCLKAAQWSKQHTCRGMGVDIQILEPTKSGLRYKLK